MVGATVAVGTGARGGRVAVGAGAWAAAVLVGAGAWAAAVPAGAGAWAAAVFVGAGTVDVSDEPHAKRNTRTTIPPASNRFREFLNELNSVLVFMIFWLLLMNQWVALYFR